MDTVENKLQFVNSFLSYKLYNHFLLKINKLFFKVWYAHFSYQLLNALTLEILNCIIINFLIFIKTRSSHFQGIITYVIHNKDNASTGQ